MQFEYLHACSCFNLDFHFSLWKFCAFVIFVLFHFTNIYLITSFLVIVPIPQNLQPVDFSFNPQYEPDFKWYDNNLLEAVMADEEHAHNFFRLLALCHTVMPENKDGRWVNNQIVFFLPFNKSGI